MGEMLSLGDLHPYREHALTLEAEEVRIWKTRLSHETGNALADPPKKAALESAIVALERLLHTMAPAVAGAGRYSTEEIVRMVTGGTAGAVDADLVPPPEPVTNPKRPLRGRVLTHMELEVLYVAYGNGQNDVRCTGDNLPQLVANLIVTAREGLADDRL